MHEAFAHMKRQEKHTQAKRRRREQKEKHDEGKLTAAKGTPKESHQEPELPEHPGTRPPSSEEPEVRGPARGTLKSGSVSQTIHKTLCTNK